MGLPPALQSLFGGIAVQTKAQKLELLAPAGGPEQLNAAIAAGADAMFLGLGHHFNARRGATSFDDESFAAACRRAHLAGSRVYVTTNVVVKDDEMARALALVRRAWLLGADAFIIQDWGLHDEVHRRWPEIEIHVSTQANVHDARGVAWCRDLLGSSRVTLSRELSLPEIARIAQEGVELEGFGHGALCFCYSGVCQMSSLGGGRSANRGACAQPCRLPYELVDAEGNHLVKGGAGRPLCPKDFRTIERLDEMRAAGLSSLKIEGRLKGADYVHAVVRAYRSAIDELEGKEASLTVAERDRLLRRAFNRDFTSAYLDGRSGNEMMSYERSNNRGELVGEVVASRDLGTSRVWRGGTNGGRERTRKVSLAEVDVLLHEPVGKGDLLEFRPVDDPSQFLTGHAAADAAAGETITCRTARPMPVGCPTRVIRSQSAMDEAARVSSSDVPRRREVDVHVVARLGEPLVVELACTDGTATASATGQVVEAARSRAVTEEDLVEHAGRLGGSAFVARNYNIELDDGCGLRFSDVHKVRSAACKALAAKILGPYDQRELGRSPSDIVIARDLKRRMPALQDESRQVEICALVTSPQAAKAARDAGASRIYATPDAIAAGNWGDIEPIAWLSEVAREPDHAWQDPTIKPSKPVAVGNVSQLALAASRGAIAEVRPCIPVHNLSALALLVKAGASAVWLSGELTASEGACIAQASPVPVGVVAYGRARAMTTEHCVLQVAGRCVHDCARCEIRREDVLLEDDKGKRYPVRTDLHGRSRVYAAQPLDAAPELEELVAGGISRFLVDGSLLEPQEVSRAVERLREALDAAREGRPAPERLPGHTAGHLHRPIE